MIRNRAATVAVLVVGVLAMGWIARAGNLEPPGPPAPTMKTLDDMPASWSQKLSAGARFRVALDTGAILDRETGLVWGVSPIASTFSWLDAQYGSCWAIETSERKGWRLPTVEELSSLIDPTQDNPALPPGHPFQLLISPPEQPPQFWTATAHPTDSNQVAFVNLNTGSVGFTPTSSSTPLQVWCVRGGYGHDAGR